jgi:hypothetical protein
MTHTTFSHIRNSAYFSFVNVEKQPKSPEGLEGNVWEKVSIRKIRKLGETKGKIFAKVDTPVVLVANNLDDLIAKNPIQVP